MEIQGSTALVTGASSGIGAAIAKQLAAAGAEVILVARTQSKLEALAETIREAGGKAHVAPCDVGEQDAVAALVERVLAEHGAPHIVVNNAGVGRWLSVEETDPAYVVEAMAVPYFAAFWVTRGFLPAMLEAGRGRVVVVNSTAAWLTMSGCTAYRAARCALRAFADSLRNELHDTPIGVLQAVFGEVTSEYFRNNPGSHERLPSINEFYGTMTPEEVAQVTLSALRTDRTFVCRPRLMWWGLVWLRPFPGLQSWLMRVTGWKRSALV